MQAPFDFEAGKVATPTFLGFDQNGQPYTALTIQRPPTISEVSAISYDEQLGTLKALGTGIGKKCDVTWVIIDSNDASNKITKVDTFNVVAPKSRLTTVQIDYTLT